MGMVARVLLWAAGVIAFICSLPFLLWGLTDAFASLFFEPRSDAHEALHFCLAFGTVIIVPHGAPYLYSWWWKRRQQRRAQGRATPPHIAAW
jgi:hypothetical protein